MCRKLCHFIRGLWWFHRSKYFEAMKAGKLAILPWLSCQYNENTLLDLPSSVYLFKSKQQLSTLRSKPSHLCHLFPGRVKYLQCTSWSLLKIHFTRFFLLLCVDKNIFSQTDAQYMLGQYGLSYCLALSQLAHLNPSWLVWLEINYLVHVAMCSNDP